MGRRSLPKIDRSISIERHYQELEDLQPPWDAASCFRRADEGADWNADTPLEIEIGSGKGLNLLDSSGKNPDRLYLGLEIAQKYARFASYRFAEYERNNAQMIRGDAARFMREFVADQTAEAIHIYFPDPWWKGRHRRRRIVNPEVMADIQRVLKPRGIFHFWTDVEEYFESACKMIAQHSDLKGPNAVPESPAEHDMDYRTHFERRMRLNEHPIFRSSFEKD